MFDGENFTGRHERLVGQTYNGQCASNRIACSDHNLGTRYMIVGGENERESRGIDPWWNDKVSSYKCTCNSLDSIFNTDDEDLIDMSGDDSDEGSGDVEIGINM